ncbi:hypothetical protein AYO44_07305 [Planctomycetaceae bacterium SCGC AG-212-F19]|nr:hypothetical protein AYO44_07305 [Planctomycetaceae bacterium SCGC AG-212-F19]
MPDDIVPTELPAEDLVLQAMLYASGELDAEQNAAFEQRLSDDQAARDALCKAVELTALPGQEPSEPDPAYRSRVRHRLRQRRRHRRGLSGDDSSVYQHPAFWSVLGAAIAVLFMVIISHIVASMSIPAPPTTPSTNQQPPTGNAVRPPVPTLEDLEAQALKAETRAASIFAQLSAASAAERPKIEAQLMDTAKELVELDSAILNLKSEQLTKDLAEVNGALAKSKDNAPALTKQRYEALFEKLKKANK